MKTTDITATLALIGVIGLAFHAFKAGGSSEKQPVLKDAIVAFESVACPTGWIAHSKSEGRFLVSAGKSSTDAKHEFNLHTTGGKLSHLHSGKTSTAPTTSGEDDKKHRRTGAHSHTFKTSEDLHVPPYYVVTFCKAEA